MTDPLAAFVNNAFTEGYPEIFGQHRIFLGDGATGYELLPRPLIHIVGLEGLDDPTPRQPAQTRFSYDVTIPRATLDAALSTSGLTIAVLEKGNDETITPWAILEAGDPLYYPVRVKSLVNWEQDNPIVSFRRLWAREEGAPPWVVALNP